ncbi:MAG: hypothetical protein LUD50_02855 [Clostridia bacterium]|nr:hypothetical protein [Clostridia bacterium]
MERAEPSKDAVIARLWSHVADLLLLICGSDAKTLDGIMGEMDATAKMCERYADADDAELYALDVAEMARKLAGEGLEKWESRRT